MNLAFAAMTFAREAHATQLRKYTGAPYWTHLAEVAGVVATLNFPVRVSQNVAVAVAWLHDTMEDTATCYADIHNRFGYHVAYGVECLTDCEVGNRATRKAASRARLAACAGWIQTIKCADLISNTSSIRKHDPKFAVTYLEEKRLLLDVLTKADYRLLNLARAQSEGLAP